MSAYRRSDTPDSEEEEIGKSLQRSRKRHLPIGLLRGDQVLDRLKLQETSASPDLKRQRSETMSLSVEEFRQTMKELQSDNRKRFDSIDEGVSDLRGSVNKLNKTVKHNTTKLDAHEAQILSTQKDISDIKNEIKKLKQAPPTVGMLSRTAESGSEIQDDDYWRARNSLRLWPVRGSTRTELWANAGAFIGNTLGFANTVPEGHISSVTRVELPSGPAVSNEVLVTFKATETRDAVIGASGRLASHTDPEGRPTAGIRLEIPRRLRGHFRTLRSYASQLRARHGPGTRTHVKFDDYDRTLFLNARLPGDSSWTKVNHNFAKRGLEERENAASQQLETRFDIGGPPVPRANRPRSQSTAGAGPVSSATSSAHTSLWTGRERAESMDH